MNTTDDTYIWVERWDEFQTFQNKKGKPWAPPWIKVYHALLDEPAYLDLTPETRCLLEGIWKLFARARGTLRKDTRNLSRQLNQRVTEQQLQRLNHAGWITFCSGTVLERKRNEFWNRSTLDVDKTREEQPPNPNPALHAHDPDDIPIDLPAILNGRQSILKDIPL